MFSNTQELLPEYDSAQSFYRKAFVSSQGNNFPSTSSSAYHELYSYEQLVAKWNGSQLIVYPLGVSSQTTLRHVKEFARQLGVYAGSKADIIRNYVTMGA